MTTSANRALEHIHHRMPVVIQPRDFSRWLDCKGREPHHVADLLVPADEDFFEAIPVSDKVNKVANMGPDVQEPVDITAETPELADEDPEDGSQLSLF